VTLPVAVLMLGLSYGSTRRALKHA
jgi:hypothetical protein